MKLLTLSALVALARAGFCPDARKTNIDSNAKQVKLQSETKANKCQDRLDILIESHKNDGLEFRLDYRTKDKLSASKFHFRQKAFSVVEFNDANNNNLVEEGEIVQTIKLGHETLAPWKDIDHTEVDEVHTFTVGAGEWFTAISRYSGDPVTFTTNKTGNITSRTYELDPLGVKIDVILQDFPYKENGTKLAIDGRMKSKARFHNKVKTPKGEEKVDFESNEAHSKFSWATTVEADGQTVNVVASPAKAVDGKDEIGKVEDGESNYKITWVFDTTKKVDLFFWDPTLAGVPPISGASNGVAPLASVVMALLVTIHALFGH